MVRPSSRSLLALGSSGSRHSSVYCVPADRLSYTKAIEVSIRKDAVFYSNRAACAFILADHPNGMAHS
jgi:hypothetical protein